MFKTPIRASIVCLILASATRAPADEGMWLLNKLPKKVFKEKYGFEPNDEWVKHVQMSCARIAGGGSGSFVSPDGLIMTNHHVGADAISDLADAKHDYLRDGFYARTKDAELKCHDMEVNVLISIEDVTDRVNADVTPATSPADAQAARKKAKAQIEKEAKDKTQLKPEIVTLYQGARYNLYLYKRYTDVRVVFAPEQDIAFFGGDLDNFEFPRFDLDVCFLRAYEDGKPAKVEHYLKWSKNGAADGELTFVAGHPGRTQRLYTVDHLRFLRDVHLPLILNSYNQREVSFIQFCGRGDEALRTGHEDLLSIQNGRKAYGGILAGLLDERIMRAKKDHEKKLRDFVESDPKRQKEYADAWHRLSSALDGIRSAYPAYFMLENRRTSLCRLYDIAKKLVRASDERGKPDGERLDEYRDASLPSLEMDLFSTAPIYNDLEQFKLADGLLRLGRILGGENPIVKTAMGDQDADTRAAMLVKGTKLNDVAFRKKLYEGGTAAINSCDDPMIRFALALDPAERKVRKQYEDEFEGVERQSYAKIARAEFDMSGDSVYPDATFTLRLSFGKVAGYQDANGPVPAMTTMGGAFEWADKHHNEGAYRLPKRWMEKKKRLDLSTPLNFVTTDDIIGGNSGSPMFNKNGEVTGLIFDGNVQSLIWDIQFDEVEGRATGVHSRAIIEALRKLYDAGSLADEITGAK